MPAVIGLRLFTQFRRPRPSKLLEDHAEELRLWLRLLSCTTQIEGEIAAVCASALM